MLLRELIAVGSLLFETTGAVTSPVVTEHVPAAILPEYCSKVNTPEALDKFKAARTVPELSFEASQLNLRLLHVSSLIRHGARTPASRYECWPNYEPHWDCDLGETVKPVFNPTNSNGARLKTDDADQKTVIGFRKIYDVSPSDNELGGTCGKGHLLREGYEQHQILGKLFADYYQNLERPLVYGATSEEAVLNNILFRSSDYQRTLLSGSSFLNSFLAASGFSIPSNLLAVHSIDLVNETMAPNPHSCPKLQSLKEELFASGTFEEITRKSASTKEAVNQMSSSLAWPGEFFDCMMTMLCAYGPDALQNALPNNKVASDKLSAGMASEVAVSSNLRANNAAREIHEFDSTNQQIIDDTMKAVDEFTTFQFTAQDRLYSKTANVKFMIEFKAELVRLLVVDITQRLGADQPALAAEMLSQVIPKEDLHEFYSLLLQKRVSSFPFSMKRFILYSGHDTSILQFLGSLGQDTFFGRWPPYASQVILEVYADTDTNKYYFRLIYNSIVITDRIAECADKSLPRDICSLNSFFEATNWATPSKVQQLCEPPRT